MQYLVRISRLFDESRLWRKASAFKREWTGLIGPYAIVASIVTVSDYLIFIGLIRIAEVAPIAANVCSWAVTIVLAYGLHSIFTFGATPSFRRFFGYVALGLTTLVLGTSIIAVSLIFISPIAAKVASTILVFSVSFALSHLTVFRTV